MSGSWSQGSIVKLCGKIHSNRQLNSVQCVVVKDRTLSRNNQLQCVQFAIDMPFTMISSASLTEQHITLHHAFKIYQEKNVSFFRNIKKYGYLQQFKQSWKRFSSSLPTHKMYKFNFHSIYNRPSIFIQLYHPFQLSNAYIDWKAFNSSFFFLFRFLVNIYEKRKMSDGAQFPQDRKQFNGRTVWYIQSAYWETD